MQRLEQAVAGLEQALGSPTGEHASWAPLVRERLRGVAEALHAERAQAADTWLSARAGHLYRERNHLLARVNVLSNALAAAPAGATDVEPVRESLVRLAHDLGHHQQRVNDLAYDGVAMEVGGSE